MKKRLLIIAFVQSLFFTCVIAQTNFRDGYVITLNHDTIHGTINNKSYSNNAQFCEFKDKTSQSIVRYYPSDLTGYRFTNGKFYITKELNGQKVFMEYLIKGKLNIYFYTNQGNNQYYASKDSLPLRELTYRSEILEVDGKQMLKESKDFIGLLSYYTADCPSFQEDIPKLKRPNHRDLIKLAEDYHALTCTDEKCIVYEKKIPSKFKLGIYGVGNMTFGNHYNQDYSSYGFNILYRQEQISERLFLGLGFFTDGKLIECSGKIVPFSDKLDHIPFTENGKTYRIPLSINYLHQKMGFSPTFSYQLNLNHIVLQNIDFGVKYQVKAVSIILEAELKTDKVVIPFGAALMLGLNFDL